MRSISNYDNIKDINTITNMPEENLKLYKEIRKSISQLSRPENLISTYQDAKGKLNQLKEENYFKDNEIEETIMTSKIEKMKNILREEDEIETLKTFSVMDYYSNYSQAMDTYKRVRGGE